MSRMSLQAAHGEVLELANGLLMLAELGEELGHLEAGVGILRGELQHLAVVGQGLSRSALDDVDGGAVLVVPSLLLGFSGWDRHGNLQRGTGGYS
jgi:hypothetical protein